MELQNKLHKLKHPRFKSGCNACLARWYKKRAIKAPPAWTAKGHVSSFGISVYADGENTASDAAKIKRHMAGCDRCRRALQKVQVADQIFRLAGKK